ncbi:hypothetical protein ACIBCN_01580 [Nocardia sp. NPDC051052]|uniref:hypothetical protein n=1 Tax=Nocardia sp. NPDC051052 TaxID=3364322 RepID=UPI0037A68D0A
MSTPGRGDNDVDARKPALAPDDSPRAYLHNRDGSWSFVGDDGWPVSPGELHADAMSAIATAARPVIDVDPIAVTDTETR